MAVKTSINDSTDWVITSRSQREDGLYFITQVEYTCFAVLVTVASDYMVANGSKTLEIEYIANFRTVCNLKWRDEVSSLIT
jgi:hypothetical protein